MWEGRGQLYATAVLPPGKKPHVSIKQKIGGGALRAYQDFKAKRQISAPGGNRTSDVQPVAK
jgi:hypothetical protein